MTKGIEIMEGLMQNMKRPLPKIIVLMKCLFPAIIYSFVYLYGGFMLEASVSYNQTSIIYSISSPYYPIVLTGGKLPSLKNVPIEKISLFAGNGASLRPIAFQIDRRDQKGIFQIPTKDLDKEREGRYPFDNNDEFVFMAAELGEKMSTIPDDIRFQTITEIEVTDPEAGKRGWVYAIVYNETPPETSVRDYVSYNRDADVIESIVYRMEFSDKLPFLIDTLVWKEDSTGRYSKDFVDIIKIRHTGKLFHRFDFVRTNDDYMSSLIAVKDGPVRVIRRTKNRVRIIWQLRTPSIYVDYILYANAFFMDTFIDIPFRIGLFFSDVETLMTIDGNDDSSLPQRKTYSNTVLDGLVMDGEMSEEEKAFNASNDKEFVISSSYGKILVALELDKDLPVQYRVYLADDRIRLDPPEDVPGQFGNIGFLSTDWEKLESSSAHMMFSVFMIKDISVEQGFEILKNSPSFVNKED